MTEIPSITAPLLPQLFRSPPGKFDAEELAQHRHTQLADHSGLLFLVVLYVASVWSLAAEVSAPEARAATGLALFAQLVSVVAAVYNLYVEFYVVPRATKEAEDSFFVTYGPFGRWVYMTHQTIGILAVHAVLSVLAPSISTRLAYGTYAVAPVVGALGVFVTIQYFNLVFTHPDHIKECRVWAARGVHYRFVDCLRHSFPICLALLDVGLLKQRSMLLLAMPSTAAIFYLQTAYGVLALCVIRVNYTFTGRWPYGMMKDFGTDASKWIGFLAVQSLLLSAFGIGLCMLARWSGALW